MWGDVLSFSSRRCTVSSFTLFHTGIFEHHMEFSAHFCRNANLFWAPAQRLAANLCIPVLPSVPAEVSDEAIQVPVPQALQNLFLCSLCASLLHTVPRGTLPQVLLCSPKYRLRISCPSWKAAVPSINGFCTKIEAGSFLPKL